MRQALQGKGLLVAGMVALCPALAAAQDAQDAPSSAAPPVVVRQAPGETTVIAYEPLPHHYLAYRERGAPARGFMMEALVGASVSVNTGSTNLLVVPGLRLGGMWRPFSFAISLNYFSNATFSDGYSGQNVITAGVDLMPTVWHSLDQRARMYVLVGGNIGAVINTNVASTSGGTGVDASDLAGGLSVGLGGRYFLHPNFALGVELGDRTQFVRPNGVTTAVSSLYGVVLATFVAGH